jgi:hypothetical protein
MNKRILRIASVLFAVALLISVVAVSSWALEWDGSSLEESDKGQNAGATGFALRTTDDNVVGYRFSVVDKAGNNKVSKVIDVFRSVGYGDYGYYFQHKFVPKYNKRQLIENQYGRFSTTVNQVNCYREATLSFATALPVPSEMKTWQNNVTNLNVVLAKLGLGSIDALEDGDKLLVEPIYDVRLESVWHTATVTELAIYGKYLLGGESTGGNSLNSASWGFISKYTNYYYPNALYTPDGQGLWPGAEPVTKRTKFNTIIQKGYGVGIAYSQGANDPEPMLDVDICEAWSSNPTVPNTRYGYSNGHTFQNWHNDSGYPVMDNSIWFQVHFPAETENFYVRQTLSIDGNTSLTRDIWSDDGQWFSITPTPAIISADKEYYTVTAQVDWIDEDGNVLKYGAEKTFYIPVQPKLNRYQVIAYGCIGQEQARSGMLGTSGAVYYGQRIYTRYQYTTDSAWTSYNALYATLLSWNGSDWGAAYDRPDGISTNTSMTAGTTKTVQSNLGYVLVPNNIDSGKNVIPFDMTTAWSADPDNTTVSSLYEIPILIADVELMEIYLVNADNKRVDHTKLTVGETVYIRYKYRNNTACTVYVDGFNTDRQRISATGVYRIPANSTITVAGGSLVVPDQDFSIWGGVYLESAGIYNTEYESNGNNNELVLACSTSYPLTLTPIVPNAPYREGTSVITSFWLSNSGSRAVTPNDDISIQLQVYQNNSSLITTQTATQVIVPAHDDNLYYFKWDVPLGLNRSSVQVVAQIIDGDKTYSTVVRHYSTCLYPQYDTPDTDYEVSAPDGFTVPAAPTATENYAAWWQWEWEDGDFVLKFYGIGMQQRSNESLTPDDRSNSTYAGGYWTMKSGYGVWLKASHVPCPVSGYLFPGTDAYTTAQFAYAAYPEFGYRYGANVCTTLFLQNDTWCFSDPAQPKYHYTPIYFPDGKYVVKIVLSDMWTPAGMIQVVSTTEAIHIKDSAYDDWFVGRT